MSEEIYIAVLCLCCFVIGIYAREKIEALIKRIRKGGSLMCLKMERYQKLYTGKQKARNNNLPLIHNFLGKRVRVKVDGGFAVEGVLIYYQNKNKANHLPNVLVLKDGNSYRILRGNFENISEVEA
jgi:small nuclear ribonucleoprotein (snRNP)-like protein